MVWWSIICVIALGVIAPGALLFLAPTVLVLVILGLIFNGESGA